MEYQGLFRKLNAMKFLNVCYNFLFTFKGCSDGVKTASIYHLHMAL